MLGQQTNTTIYYQYHYINYHCYYLLLQQLSITNTTATVYYRYDINYHYHYLLPLLLSRDMVVSWSDQSPFTGESMNSNHEVMNT